jgi:RHS repeat-associated protein
MNYDAAGNLLSYLTAYYTYDQENRLLSTAGMTYTYDGNGERVLKSNTSTGAAVKRYWSMGGNTLTEGDGTGNLTAEYVYFGGKRIARIDLPANTVHYYLSDHLGSTSIVAIATGTVEEESDFYPFGTEVVVTGGVNDLKFTGKRRDTESQLDYFGARYYSNGLGRFLTPDWAASPEPVPYAYLDDPQSLNLYGYVRNVPTTRIDADGHKCKQTGQRFDCNYHFKDPQDEKRKEARTVPFPLVIEGTGAMATAAAGGLVIGAAYAFITNTADALVANSEDEEIAAARYSVLDVENALFMSKNKDTLKVIKGLVAAAAIELGKVTGTSPEDPHHKQEGRAMLDRAKRLAERLPAKFRDAILQGIKSIEGRVPGGMK